jgi:predicted RNA-binding protein with PUA-like domain
MRVQVVMPSACWLFSTEPASYPWSIVQKEGRVLWDGIRGTSARKWMRAIRPGDEILGYHASPEKALVCVCSADGPAVPDPQDPSWLAIPVAWGLWLERPVTLSAMRTERGLAAMKFLRMPRLSVSPVTEEERRILLAAARAVC